MAHREEADTRGVSVPALIDSLMQALNYPESNRQPGTPQYTSFVDALHGGATTLAELDAAVVSGDILPPFTPGLGTPITRSIFETAEQLAEAQTPVPFEPAVAPSQQFPSPQNELRRFAQADVFAPDEGGGGEPGPGNRFAQFLVDRFGRDPTTGELNVEWDILADGRLLVSDLSGNQSIYDFVDGEVRLVGDDPFGVSGGQGAQPLGFQNVGVDPRTGRQLVMDRATGGVSLAGPEGFAGVDPREAFEAERGDAARRLGLEEADLLRNVLSKGGDFLFREAFGRGATPPKAFVSQEDVLRQALPGFEGGTPPEGGNIAQFLSNLPSGTGFAPGVSNLNPAQRTGVAQQSRETLGGGPIREFLGGAGFQSLPGQAFRTPTPSMISALTNEQAAAAGAASIGELNVPFEDIAQESVTGFFSPKRRTRGRAVIA